MRAFGRSVTLQGQAPIPEGCVCGGWVGWTCPEGHGEPLRVLKEVKDPGRGGEADRKVWSLGNQCRNRHSIRGKSLEDPVENGLVISQQIKSRIAV